MSQFPTYDPPPVANVPAGVAPVRTSVMAVVSLVLGILGFCSGGLLGLVGVVLGIIAIVKVNRSAGAMKGSGLAIAGICVGACSVLMCPLYLGLFLPALAKARQNAQTLKAQAQLGQLAAVVVKYADANNDHFPPVDDWIAALDPYVANQANDLAAWPGDAEDGRAFAMNAQLNGIRMGQVTYIDMVPLLFEVSPGSPMSGGPELLPQRSRSGSKRGYLILFADGRVATIPREQIESGKGYNEIIWDPLRK